MEAQQKRKDDLFMKKQIRGYIAGVLSAALIMGGAAYAKSGFENIGVSYDNIKVYIDNTLAELTDANGTRVEPFIYNGTTYLPVRGVAQAMNAQVTWDGATKSVHIWDKMVPSNTFMLDVCEPYDTSECKTSKSSEGETFDMDGKKYSNGLTFGHWSNGSALFNLDGRFNSLSFDIGHTEALDDEKSVSFVVDGKTVKTVTLEPDQLAKHVTIPLNYGLQLKIVCDGWYVGVANMVVE